MMITKAGSSRMLLSEGTMGLAIGGTIIILLAISNLYWMLTDAKYSQYWFMGLLSIPAALVGAFMILMQSTTKILLDKESGKILFSKKKVFSSQSMEFPLSELREIRLIKMEGSRSRVGYTIHFDLGSKKLQFVFGGHGHHKMDLLGTEEKMVRDAQEIASFAGVPFRKVDLGGAPLIKR